MAEIIFLEKTGCINNTKQKKILIDSGHTVRAVNLLHYNWTEDDLLLFFSKMEVKDWFNTNAPAVQNGKVNPNYFTRSQALQALVEDPILIKRPLLIIGNKTLVGFDATVLDELIGLNPQKTPELATLLRQNLSICPQKVNNTTCT